MTPAAAVVAAQALRRRRIALGGGSATLAAGWVVVMSVVVVAIGGTPPPADIAASAGIPPVAFDAYGRAAASSTGVDCGLRWQILAGVARVESNHASGRTIAPDGSVSPPILGPVLDGSGGNAAIADSDKGVLDDDPIWDRAVGPFQFIPTSWDIYGADGNGDGSADPHNFYDAALAATDHLCNTRAASLSDERELRAALYRYNRSDRYVAAVLDWIRYYDNVTLTGPSAAGSPTGTIVSVQGIRVDQSIAPAVDALLSAANRDGLALAGSGYRSRDQQIALRRANCGTSPYAIYDMAAAACTPPTARPGQSLHETGLAIDFTCDGLLVTSADPCFAWLQANAATYGLRNLPSENWHWSSTGR